MYALSGSTSLSSREMRWINPRFLRDLQQISRICLLGQSVRVRVNLKLRTDSPAKAIGSNLSY